MSYSKCHSTRRAINGLAPLALLALTRWPQEQKLGSSGTQG
jgi:hypothetical protein